MKNPAMSTSDNILFHRIIQPRRKLAGDSLLVPALILLHGRGSNEEDLLGLAPYLDERLLFLSLRAPFDFPYGGYMWYDSSRIGSPEPTQFKKSHDQITSFIKQLPTAHPVDPKRIFLFGFSMGAIMSFAVGLANPGIVRGIIAHSGYLPEVQDPPYYWDAQQKTDYFIAHGTHDPIISISFAHRSKELMERSNALVTYKEYPIAHHVSEESLQDLSAWLTERISLPSS